MSKHFDLLLVLLLPLSGCMQPLQTALPAWQTRGEAMNGLIETRIELNQYDSTDIYQRDGLYYAARQDRGMFVYSPAEAEPRLLDSRVHFTTPTASYLWEFSKGIPDGLWAYQLRYDTVFFRVETYRQGELVKREKFRSGQPSYYIETLQNGRVIKREGVDSPPEK